LNIVDLAGSEAKYIGREPTVVQKKEAPKAAKKSLLNTPSPVK